MLHPLSVIAALAIGAVFWRSAELVTFVLAIALIYVVCKPPRFLNNPITQYLVLISYSLYLCHEYTSNVLWTRLFGQAHSLPPAVGVTLQILLAIAGATLLIMRSNGRFSV